MIAPETVRSRSTIFGLFFAGTFLFSVPALALYGRLLSDPDYVLGAGNDLGAALGGLSEVLLAICNVATAVVLYPIVKRTGPATSLGYVAIRIVESLLILAGVMALMSIVTLRTSATPEVDASSLRAVGRGLLAFHDWTFLFGPQFCAGLGNGILLGSLLYRARLVPPRMAMMGIIGGTLAFLGGVLVLLGVLKPMSPGLFALTAVEIAWELGVTYYALRHGFRGAGARYRVATRSNGPGRPDH